MILEEGGYHSGYHLELSNHSKKVKKCITRSRIDAAVDWSNSVAGMLHVNMSVHLITVHVLVQGECFVRSLRFSMAVGPA